MRGLFWIPAMLGVAGFVAYLDPYSGVRNWLSLRVDLDRALHRIEELETQGARLRVEALELAEDEFAIERAIREDLLYVRGGETLLRLRAGDVVVPSRP